jgi:hypothetical protein
MTVTSMNETAYRIGMYLRSHGDLPDGISGLPVRDGHLNRTTDGWGKPLVFERTSSNSFTLTSLGRDGASGGNGDDQDIVRRYQVENGEIDAVQ